MHAPVTVATLAWNEADCIVPTLESVVSQDYPGEVEIIVGVNGSTDGTAQRVREMQEFWPNVRLIEIEEQGKPNAWNITRAEAAHNYILFTDGDVWLFPDAVTQIVRRLDAEPDITGVAGLPVTVTDHCDYLTTLMSLRYEIPSCLIGRLYGVRNDILQQTLEESKHAPNAKMPKDIIHEDAWLTTVVGRENWVPHPEAKAAYMPYHWSEAVRLAARHIRAEKQIREIFGDGYKDAFIGSQYESESFSQRTTRRLHNLFHKYGPLERIEVVCGYVARTIANRIAQGIVRREEKKKLSLTEAWEDAPRSKLGIKMPQYTG